MKTWQLTAVYKDFNNILQIVNNNEKWSKYRTLYENYNDIVDTQNREQLDQILDEDFVLAVVEHVTFSLYLDEEGWLRSWRLHETDIVLSAKEVLLKFGGEYLFAAYDGGTILIKDFKKEDYDILAKKQ